jgi:hypothetical protein
MTLLTHAPGTSYRAARPKARRNSYAATVMKGPKLKAIARVCRFALTVTLITVALAGIIALKASIYLARFSS